jgi:hypothetical protein
MYSNCLQDDRAVERGSARCRVQSRSYCEETDLLIITTHLATLG